MSKKFRNFRVKYNMSEKFCNFRVKYKESSIGFENLAYLQSIENKCKLLIDNKTFLDSPFGSEKVVIGIAAIESSVLAGKLTSYCIALV